MENFAEIFSEVHNNITAVKVLNAKFYKSLPQNSPDELKEVLSNIWKSSIDQCLVCVKKEAAITRIIKFVIGIITSNDNDLVLTSCMTHLLQRSKAIDKVIRTNACQFIEKAMIEISNKNVEISEGLIDTIVKEFSPRLRDRVPAIRVSAINVLKFLQNTTNNNDEVTLDLSRLLQSDSSKDVRVAVIQSITITELTLPLIIARIRDIRPEVRVATCKRLGEGPITVKNLDSKSLSLIVRYGLNDRDKTVKDACKKLILIWLVQFNNVVPRLLRSMDFEIHEEEAEMLGYAIMEMVEKDEGNFIF